MFRLGLGMGLGSYGMAVKRGGSEPLPPTAFDFAFIEARTNTLRDASPTFAAMNIGAAHPDRLVIVSITWETTFSGTGRWVTGVSIGGIAATKAADVHSEAASGGGAAIWYAHVPSGTTADVVLTGSGSMSSYDRLSLAAYRAVGVISATPSDAGSHSGSPASLAINHSANGVVVAVVSRRASPSDNGLTGVGLDAANLQSGAGHTASHGSKVFPVAGSVNLSATTRLAAAAWV